MRLRRLALPCLILSLTALPAFAQTTVGKKFAVLVGVENYEHASLRDPPLKYACDDVADLAELLKTSGYAVTLLTDGDSALAPTQANITRTIAATLEQCRAADTVILAFAGHGLQFAGQPDAYFCPSDARPFADRTETLVSISHTYRQLEQSFAGVKVIFVDACRNDPSPGRGRGVDADSAPHPPRGVAALFSCSAGQRAFEHDDLKHGVFFHHILQGLRGEAANRNGDITFQLLSNYVCAEVPGDITRLLPQQRQFPNMKADLVGVPPVLARVTPALPNPAPQPAPQPSTGISNLSRFDTPLHEEARENFRSILLAMHNYHDQHKHFPPPVILGKDGKGKVPHSWRVEILPYLNDPFAQKLYDSYQFDQTWDSPANRKILDAIPAIYRSPMDLPNSTSTSAFVLTPPLDAAGRPTKKDKFQTVFSEPVGTSLVAVTDGSSNTLAVVEARRLIPWTKPEDLVYETDKALPALGGWFAQGFHGATSDGWSQFFSKENSEGGLRGLIHMNDNTLMPEWHAVKFPRDTADPLVAALHPVRLATSERQAQLSSHMKTASGLMEKREYDQAIAQYNAALRIDPESAAFLFARGKAWQAKGDSRRAGTNYRAVLVNEPNNILALAELAWCLATNREEYARDGKEALIHALNAYKLDPTNHHVLNALAAAHAEVGEYEVAATRQAEAIKLLQEKPQPGATAAALQKDYRLRQERYEQKQAWRE